MIHTTLCSCARASGKSSERDPLLLTCAYNKHRLYLFTPREPEDTEDAATGRWADSFPDGAPEKGGLGLWAGLV